jgi:hypothetical protein
MGYSSDLTDREWETTLAIAATEEKNSTSCVDKAATIKWDIISTQEWL